MEKYCGNARPYIYVLFGDTDRAEAEIVMSALSAKGHSLWYGDEFNQKEEARLHKAAALLVVISPDFAESDTLKKAVGQATKANIPIIAVYREWVKLSPGLSMQLGTNLGVVRTNFDTEEEYLAKLCDSPVLFNLEVTPAQKAAAKQATLRLALGAVAAVAAMVILVLYRLLMVSPIEEDSELGRLGLSGNALEYKQMYVYGETIRDSYSPFQMTEITRTDEEGYVVFRMVMEDTGEALKVGKLTDAAAFGQLTNLEELCLAGNEITSVDGLENLTRLRLLDLSANEQMHQTDLSPLAQLPNLEVLNLAYTHVENLRPLRSCPALKTLYLCRQSEWAVEQANLRGIEIIYVDTEVTNFAQLKAACADKAVVDIWIDGNITIPEGEVLTIRSNTRVCTDDDRYRLVNNGTLNIAGTLSINGGSTFVNNGTVMVKENGLYHTEGTGSLGENHGDFTVDSKGSMVLGWGQFLLQEGSFLNNGYIQVRDLGELHFNGGTLRTNGNIEVALMGQCLHGDGKFVGDPMEITGDGRLRIGERFVTIGGNKK